MTIGICNFDAVMGSNPANMTLDNGTPIAGVFAGTTYATAMVSALLSQSLDEKKQVTVQTA